MKITFSDMDESQVERLADSLDAAGFRHDEDFDTLLDGPGNPVGISVSTPRAIVHAMRYVSVNESIS